MEYHWQETDALVDEAHRRNLSIFATLAYSPTWATGGPKNTPPKYLEDWQRYIRMTVDRYKSHITHWGMWNEPNLPAYFQGTAQDYVNLVLAPGAAAVKEVDPHAKICGPEISTEGNWAGWLQDFAAALGHTPLDIITVHSYQDTGRDVLRHMVGPQTWLMWMKERVGVKGQRPMREVLTQVGLGNKPLWLTEVGWKTDDVSEAEQASYYDQLLESLPEPELLEKVFLYQLNDEPARDGNPPVRWGIMHEDLTPKPAYHKVQKYLKPGVG